METEEFREWESKAVSGESPYATLRLPGVRICSAIVEDVIENTGDYRVVNVVSSKGSLVIQVLNEVDRAFRVRVQARPLNGRITWAYGNEGAPRGEEVLVNVHVLPGERIELSKSFTVNSSIDGVNEVIESYLRDKKLRNHFRLANGAQMKKNTDESGKAIESLVVNGNVGSINTKNKRVKVGKTVMGGGEGPMADQDMKKLEEELMKVLNRLKIEAATPEQFSACAELASATTALSESDAGKANEHLAKAKSVGTWVLGAATAVGTTLLGHYLKKMWGL